MHILRAFTVQLPIPPQFLLNSLYVLYTIFPFVSTQFSALTFKKRAYLSTVCDNIRQNQQFRKNENMRITKKALIRIKNIRRLISIIIKSGTHKNISVCHLPNHNSKNRETDFYICPSE